MQDVLVTAIEPDRASNPNDLVDEFDAETCDAFDSWAMLVDSVEMLVTTEPYEPAVIARRVTLDAFLRLAITWEVFRSEWYIAVVTTEPTRFQSVVGETLSRAINQTRYKAATEFMQIAWPRPLSPSSVRELMDSDGLNLTFQTSRTWQARSQHELPNEFASLVLSLSGQDLNFLDFLAAARNWLAHASRRSHDAFRSAADSVGPLFGESPTARHPADFAEWLLRTSGKGTRFEDCCLRLRAVARRLRSELPQETS